MKSKRRKKIKSDEPKEKNQRDFEPFGPDRDFERDGKNFDKKDKGREGYRQSEYKDKADVKEKKKDKDKMTPHMKEERSSW